MRDSVKRGPLDSALNAPLTGLGAMLRSSLDQDEVADWIEAAASGTMGEIECCTNVETVLG